MKRLVLKTTITLEDALERHLYQYVESNGYGHHHNELKNTGHFENRATADGIEVLTEATIEDVSDNRAASL